MVMIGSAKKATSSKVTDVPQTAHPMVSPMKMEIVHAQAVDSSMEANALLPFHAHLDQHSTQPPKPVFVTADLKTSSMDNARLVAKIVSGTQANACARLDFSKLVEFVKLVILEPNTMGKIVSAI